MTLQGEHEEKIISFHSKERWMRKRKEIEAWDRQNKVVRKPKATVPFLHDEVDEELFPALFLLNDAGVHTQYSCAGVSLLDDPIHHSLYAYVTILDSKKGRNLIAELKRRMRHRLLVTYEPKRKRYDLSSFYIKHNRSFCFLLYQYAMCWKKHP